MAAVTVDEILSQIGGYGKYQILMLQLVGFIEFGLSSFNVMIITFIAGEPTWECVSNSTVCNITGKVDTTSDDYNARCDMPRSEWKFSDTFTSTVTEVCRLCYTVGRIIMAMACKYAFLVSFNTVYILSSELFPTSVRSIGLGTSSACARIGSFLALYVVWLIRIHALLPYTIVVVLCVIIGLICFRFLPETLNKPTPESMEAVLEMKPVEAAKQEISLETKKNAV
ncbi:solute carrier family 22 member 4-like [Dendronephthya gigantea]|uniref:solute carrier family 22 member 4-like n=1 Tax=Dendronephthya gigantea TaxID=151771 RepID=UPI00106BA92C|nr:solute carrier family 22 member 4-like [Dendronephthya gigantea]